METSSLSVGGWKLAIKPSWQRRAHLSLQDSRSQDWLSFRHGLFPWLAEERGPLSERHKRLVQVLEWVRVEELLPGTRGSGAGRPPESRAALARALLAKPVCAGPTTRALLERLRNDPPLRRLCGWEQVGAVPSEATFWRAFAGFATSELAGRLHEALVERTLRGDLAGPVSRDSTAIPAREQPVRQSKPVQQQRKRGRPRQGEERPPPPPRLERQESTTLAELPRVCDPGVQRNAQGYQEKWPGYKVHSDAIDGGLPGSCVLPSASRHDSQAALALAQRTAGRVEKLYDLMDSAYDAAEMRACRERLGPVAIIDPNPRRDAHKKAELKREALARRSLGQRTPEAWRYRERSTVERVNGRLKDEFGGRHVRVRGHAKVLCHLLFGIVALTIDPLLRLTL